jgi:predicted permease
MGPLWQDVRYGVRMLRKSPGFAAIALITLAIGIGANTIMFSLVNVLLLRPVQVKGLDELAVCQAENADWHFPYFAYMSLRDSNPVFTEVAGVGGLFPPATWARRDRAGEARRALTSCVSWNYFSFLGAVPAQGRWFLPEEEHPGAEPVVVLSYLSWQRCGLDPEMIGSHVLLNGKPFRVVGVAAREFTGTSLAGPDLWVPLGCYGLLLSAWRTVSEEAMHYPSVIPIGRLKPGLAMEEAQARIQALAPSLRSDYPQWWAREGILRLSPPSRMGLIPLRPDGERLLSSSLSLCLLAVSTVVLLIACLNLGSMMIVQGTMRQREIAIRMAVGGCRWRIVRQLLLECLLMSLVGGALGCFIALGGIRAVNAWIGAARLPVAIPPSFMAELDGRVLIATLGFCALAAVLAGLKPALRLSRRDLIADLKESSGDVFRTPRRNGWAPRGWSVAGQTALSVVLVLGAALFTRSAMKAVRADSDFDFGGKLLIEIDLHAVGYDSIRGYRTCAAILDRLRALPGVEAVALSQESNFSGTGWFSGSVYEYVPGADRRPAGPPIVRNSMQYRVGVDYFRVLDLPLLQGRPFRELDRGADAEKVVIVDERLARQLRPDGNALGCLICWGHGPAAGTNAPHRVVGIVPQLRTASEDRRAVQGQLYTAVRETLLPSFLHVLARDRTLHGQEVLIRSLSQEIHRVAPELPVLSVTTLKERHQDDLFVWLTGLGARLAITFGAMALFLAALGMYGIKAHMVASRTPEIGIRMALGATRRDVMGMVLREGMVCMLAGALVGLAAGLTGARLIGNLFYGVHPLDPASIVLTVVLLGAASLLAGYLPARRAAKVDPMVALRYE